MATTTVYSTSEDGCIYSAQTNNCCETAESAFDKAALGTGACLCVNKVGAGANVGMSLNCLNCPGGCAVFSQLATTYDTSCFSCVCGTTICYYVNSHCSCACHEASSNHTIGEYCWGTTLTTGDFRSRTNLGCITSYQNTLHSAWVNASYNTVASCVAALNCDVATQCNVRTLMYHADQASCCIPNGTDYTQTMSANIRMSEQAGTCQDPKIVVCHTCPASDAPHLSATRQRVQRSAIFRR